MDDLVQQARDHAAGMGWRSELLSKIAGLNTNHVTVNGRSISDAANAWNGALCKALEVIADTPDPTAALLTALADEVVRLRADGMRAAIGWLEREAAERVPIINRLISTDPTHADLSAYLYEHDVLSTACSFMVNRDDESSALAGEQGDTP